MKYITIFILISFVVQAEIYDNPILSDKYQEFMNGALKDPENDYKSFKVRFGHSLKDKSEKNLRGLFNNYCNMRNSSYKYLSDKDSKHLGYLEDYNNGSGPLFMKREALMFLYFATEQSQYAIEMIRLHPHQIFLFKEIKDSNFNLYFKTYLSLELLEYKNIFDSKLGFGSFQETIIANSNNDAEYKELTERYINRCFKNMTGIQLTSFKSHPEKSELYLSIYVRKCLGEGAFDRVKRIFDYLKAEKIDNLSEVLLKEVSKFEQEQKAFDSFTRTLK